MSSTPLFKEIITTLLRDHLDAQRDYPPTDLYHTILTEIEKPLLMVAMEHTHNNLSKAAAILGISRITLRKKLAQIKS